MSGSDLDSKWIPEGHRRLDLNFVPDTKHNYIPDIYAEAAHKVKR